MTKTFTLLVFLSFTFLSSNAQETIQKILYHEYDKTLMTTASQKQLAKLIQQLKEWNVISVSVRSYADKQGTSGYNKRLSEQRSESILKTLQTQLPDGIAYTINHFGEDSLLTLNDDEQAKNRRSILLITYRKEEPETISESYKPVVELTPYIEDVEEQHYNINLDDSVFIIGKEGTTIQFAPETFQDKERNIVKGNATLLMKEYYNPSDIFLSGTHSLSPNGLLQTSGMFRLFIVQHKDTLLAETRKPVQISLPAINKLPLPMTVFTANHGDTSLWNDTRNAFNFVQGKWNWPKSEGKLHDFSIDKDIPFSRWSTGRKWSDESYPFSFISFRKEVAENVSKPIAKHVRYTITKRDSDTLSVHLSETFRRRGYKRYATKTFDTSFLVVYFPPFYKAPVTSLNFINCDRFISSPEVTNFYVKTTGFKGARLLVYFKRLNAYMPAPYSKGKYEINRVPADEKVEILAIGKKGKNFILENNPSSYPGRRQQKCRCEKFSTTKLKRCLQPWDMKNKIFSKRL